MSQSVLECHEREYDTAIDQLKMESDLVWSRFNAMLTANAVLLAAGALLHDSMSSVARITIPILGMCVSLIWVCLNLQGFAQCGKWWEAACAAERELTGADSGLLLGKAAKWPKDVVILRHSTVAVAVPAVIVIAHLVLLVEALTPLAQ